jgi:hypothetical protein
MSKHYDTIEHYAIVGHNELARRALDEGLIFAINVLVLHDLGMSIGVGTTDGEITSVFLTESDEPVCFDDATLAIGKKKLHDADHHTLPARVQAHYDKKQT